MRYLVDGIVFVVSYALIIEWLGWGAGTVLVVLLVCLRMAWGRRSS
jgi:hypothetical protein